MGKSRFVDTWTRLHMFRGCNDLSQHFVFEVLHGCKMLRSIDGIKDKENAAWDQDLLTRSTAFLASFFG